MTGITYRLILEEPLLATGVFGEPNSAVSLPFVPGSMICGALAAAYLRNVPTTVYTDDETVRPVQQGADDPVFRRMFLDGATRFLHAYPLIEERRALPVAMSWYEEKEDTTCKVYDFLLAPYSIKDPKPLRGLAGQSEDTLYTADIPWQINVHTQRNARAGRATEGAGAVYRYQALPAGMILEGAILTRDANDLRTLRGLLAENELLMGGARSAGYGRVSIQQVADCDADWSETGETLDPEASYNQVVVRCLSDVLLRDNQGQYSTDLVAELQRRLRDNDSPHRTLTVVSREGQLGDGHGGALFQATQIVGGFNRTWGLPLPQTLALAAGSVCALNIEPAVNGAQLLGLQHSGIGERRSDGYGRVAFTPVEFWRERGILQRIKRCLTMSQLTGIDSPHAERQAQRIATRLLRQDVERALEQAIQAIDVDGEVSNSQIAAWRTLLRSARMEETSSQRIKRILAFWDACQSKRNSGWQSLQNARVRRGAGEDLSLAAWLRRILVSSANETKGDTTALQPFEKDKTERTHTIHSWVTLPAPRILGNVRADIDEEMLTEVKIRLMDGVLAHVALQQRSAKRNSRGGTHD
jgi:CRISPR-associated protein Csx10